MASHDSHKVPLWALFVILVALTAAEVGFYEVWKATAQAGEPFVPKVVMVLVLLFVLTLPKALIVLIYFMHLKFEKQLILALAAFPLVTAAVAVLPTLVDARALKPRAHNHPSAPIGIYHPESGEHGHQPPAPRDDDYY